MSETNLDDVACRSAEVRLADDAQCRDHEDDEGAVAAAEAGSDFARHSR